MPFKIADFDWFKSEFWVKNFLIRKILITSFYLIKNEKINWNHENLRSNEIGVIGTSKLGEEIS